MRFGLAAALGLAGFVLAGCNAGVGGAPTVMALAPTDGGGIAGGAIGKDLSSADQRAAREAEYKALEYGRTGTPVAWSNGKNHGEVVPGASYRVNEYTCRDFTHTLFVGGQQQSARGTACRQPSGTWQPVT